MTFKLTMERIKKMSNRRFEFISKYKNSGINLPTRKTSQSAGYDFEVVEDTIVPSWLLATQQMSEMYEIPDNTYLTLEQMSEISKKANYRPTLVPTGVKCKLNKDEFLTLNVRSSSALKCGLVLANGTGIIDADYYNNKDNEGHIYFMLMNLSPYNIIIRKGEIVGQGIIHNYLTVDDKQESINVQRTGGFGSTTNND